MPIVRRLEVQRTSSLYGGAPMQPKSVVSIRETELGGAAVFRPVGGSSQESGFIGLSSASVAAQQLRPHWRRYTGLSGDASLPVGTACRDDCVDWVLSERLPGWALGMDPGVCEHAVGCEPICEIPQRFGRWANWYWGRPGNRDQQVANPDNRSHIVRCRGS
jgi:hypothetical protein